MTDEITPFPPQEVSDVLLAFPASLEGIIPPEEDIPDEFYSGQHWACQLQRDWFFFGLEELQADWRVDDTKAMRHLATIQGSFEPSHEHKEAAVAYLLASWIEGEPTWKRREKASR